MNCKIDEVKTKPDDWPANAIECQLENIQTKEEIKMLREIWKKLSERRINRKLK